MSKPMIITLLEQFPAMHDVMNATDMDADQTIALFDEINLLTEGPGGTRHAAIERGRIFAGMSGMDGANFMVVASVIGDMLHWLASEGTEGDVGKAVLYGCGEYQAVRQ